MLLLLSHINIIIYKLHRNKKTAQIAESKVMYDPSDAQDMFPVKRIAHLVVADLRSNALAIMGKCLPVSFISVYYKMATYHDHCNSCDNPFVFLGITTAVRYC